jgi:V8-like Glu-specific endopeptidase
VPAASLTTRTVALGPLVAAATFGLAVAIGIVGPGALEAGATAATKVPTRTYYDGSATVGALFGSATATSHFCTASVVDSSAGDVILTAAHCLRGTGAGLVFVPEYRDGKEPLGAWTVTAAYGAPAWIRSGDTDDDFAFLTVAPRTIHGHLTQIQSVTGGHELGFAPAPGKKVTVPAYAAGSDDRPFYCGATVYYDGAFPAFKCHSYPGGTSGAPWLLDTPVGETVSGVIGGLHQGGCTVLTSYTSPFGSDAWSAYDRAEKGTDPDTFPPAGSDGC